MEVGGNQLRLQDYLASMNSMELCRANWSPSDRETCRFVWRGEGGEGGRGGEGREGREGRGEGGEGGEGGGISTSGE